jgi:sensor domain CHASE-containing protein
MNMANRVRKRIRKSRGYLTAERLACSLRTDIRTVKKTLAEMEKTGEVTLTTWERLIHMDK